MSYGPAFRYGCGALSLVIVLLFTVRALSDSKRVMQELENPVAFSVFPTYTMTLMLLAAYARPFIGGIALALWIAALALHGIVLFVFVGRFVLKFKIETVFPSWFIVFVGFVVGSVTSPTMNMKPLGQVLFYIGLGFYVVLLPIVLYRVLKIKKIPDPARPGLAIFAAPVSLCLAGYLAAFDHKSLPFVAVMLGVSGISYLLVLGAMGKLLRSPFVPSFSAFTFPLVISAIAIKSAQGFFAAGGAPLPVFAIAVLATTGIAAVLVLFVLYRYTVFLLARPSS
jgi:exfoliative toxin A/B